MRAKIKSKNTPKSALPRPSVAVVTPYYKETDDVLRQCIESVSNQSYKGKVIHILVSDGHPNSLIDEFPNVKHVILPNANGDNGDTPRSVGSLLAMNMPGVGAITYLDADNWYYPDHISTIMDFQEKTGADICSCNRNLHQLDGSFIAPDPENNGKTHVDTSNIILFPPAFRMGVLWGMIPRPLSPHCDRVFFQAVRGSGFTHSHCDAFTVAFRTQYFSHYETFNLPPPEGAKMPEENNPPIEWWRSLSNDQRLKWQRFFAIGGWR